MFKTHKIQNEREMALHQNSQGCRIKCLKAVEPMVEEKAWK